MLLRRFFFILGVLFFFIYPHISYAQIRYYSVVASLHNDVSKKSIVGRVCIKDVDHRLTASLCVADNTDIEIKIRLLDLDVFEIDFDFKGFSVSFPNAQYSLPPDGFGISSAIRSSGILSSSIGDKGRIYVTVSHFDYKKVRVDGAQVKIGNVGIRHSLKRINSHYLLSSNFFRLIPSGQYPRKGSVRINVLPYLKCVEKCEDLLEILMLSLTFPLMNCNEKNHLEALMDSTCHSTKKTSQSYVYWIPYPVIGLNYFNPFAYRTYFNYQHRWTPY